MSFITSRKGSLLLAALLVLTLLVYLLFHLLAPRVVQSTDDAYVHADFTLVAPKVAGFVQDVLVEDNQPVKAASCSPASTTATSAPPWPPPKPTCSVPRPTWPMPRPTCNASRR